MVTVVELATALVVTVTVALVGPAATVTVAGTEPTDASLLDRETAAPPAGAGPFNVAVPTEEVAPVTFVTLRASADRLGAKTVSDAVCEVPPAYDAEMVTVVDDATALVVTRSEERRAGKEG